MSIDIASAALIALSVSVNLANTKTTPASAPITPAITAIAARSQPLVSLNPVAAFVISANRSIRDPRAAVAFIRSSFSMKDSNMTAAAITPMVVVRVIRFCLTLFAPLVAQIIAAIHRLKPAITAMGFFMSTSSIILRRYKTPTRIPMATAILKTFPATLEPSFPAILDTRIISAMRRRKPCIFLIPFLMSSSLIFDKILKTPAMISIENDIESTMLPNLAVSPPAILLTTPISMSIRANTSITSKPLNISSGSILLSILSTIAMIPRATAILVKAAPLFTAPANRLAIPI